MKKSTLFLSVIALVAVALSGIVSCSGGKTSENTEANAEGETAAAAKGAIVYFNLDKVLTEYDMANDLRSVVETKAQSISEEVNRRGNKLQNDVNSFQEKINKGLITRSVAEAQGQKLEEQRNAFNEYANQKNQEIAEEQQVMMNNIGNAIKEFLDKYTAEKGYAMVITTQGDILPAPVAAGDPSLDITEDVITRLNDEYIKSKSKNSGKSSE
ncbi:MAG: OmpH family outer membrane protein [Candidatus Cryptobacteroides sp.]|nr:OmpH family outer membrane protein [Bacteroidales bacterium]